MKEETLQLIPQKFKGSKETTINIYMPTNWTIWKKQIPSNI